jgi:hypothetical protein
MMSMQTLPHSFYDRDAENVARDLLGKLIVRRVDHRMLIGRIVETEAYLGPHDLAAHSSKGRTARTAVMFGPPGHAYVYLIYGMHHCLNVVTGPGDHASAVLIRALEPVENLSATASGPGRLCSHERSWPALALALVTPESGPASHFASTSREMSTSRGPEDDPKTSRDLVRLAGQREADSSSRTESIR